MNKSTKQNSQLIIKRLKQKYPQAKTILRFTNPMEMLVSAILSAQCTDKRVNIVTEKLFQSYRSIEDYANADLRKFEQEIKSTGFYRNKALNIINSAKIILKNFNRQVPDNMNDLLTLPGVSRKTANVVLGNAFGKVEGIAVDTHVKRVAHLIGLSESKTPEKIEQDLMKTIPKKEWFVFSHLIQFLGRDVCKANRQEHIFCVLKDICPSSKI